MKALIVVCNFEKKSFNHAIAEKVKQEYTRRGYEVIYHDLYEESFNPILSVEEYNTLILEQLPDKNIIKYCEELQDADAITIIHPDWWGQPPALLKGWIDRVFRRGVAYRYSSQGKAEGLLKAQSALVINTINTPEEVEKVIYKDPLDNLWNINILGMCGVKNIKRYPMYGVVKSTLEQRKKWLEEIAKLV